MTLTIDEYCCTKCSSTPAKMIVVKTFNSSQTITIVIAISSVNCKWKCKRILHYVNKNGSSILPHFNLCALRIIVDRTILLNMSTFDECVISSAINNVQSEQSCCKRLGLPVLLMLNRRFLFTLTFSYKFCLFSRAQIWCHEVYGIREFTELWPKSQCRFSLCSVNKVICCLFLFLRLFFCAYFILLFGR